MNALLQPRWVCRAMAPADLEAVLAVESAAYSHAWTWGNFVDSLTAGYLAQVLEAPQAGLVGYFVAMPGVDELHLLNVTVAPAWQGQGLGGYLLDRVQAAARALGAATLWLEVRRGNLRAQALYRRRGFVEVGLRRGYYPAASAQREDAVVMNLVLQRGGSDALE
jgi:ribosomal-protein-alanine N-acetyltransferase